MAKLKPTVTLLGQDPEVGKEVRDLGLLGRINQELLRPAGYLLQFVYGLQDDPAHTGPLEIKIVRLEQPR